MSKLVTIYGGSGFLGRQIARRMAKRGWRVRVAVRHVNDALFVRPYGVVGQVEPVFCNIRDDQTVRDVMRGADVVVNCIGILAEKGRNTFGAVQEEGAERVARISREEGVGRLVQISAIGADAESSSEYSRTKAAGEAAVLEHRPDAVIMRPSIMFGPGDSFFNKFADMTLFSPVLPLVGAKTKFQPVYVDDVAHAVEKAVLGEASSGIYELGGPDVSTFRELMKEMLGVIRRRRLMLPLPFFLARILAFFAEWGHTLSLGILPQPITRDQCESLRSDNIVHDGVKTFADLGIKPTATEAVLPEYLWRFRPSGQYLAIKESARNLHTE
ncbi:NAD(P)H-binding protein [Aquicoccus sp. SCR17]|nr:NAD(P)H-binding protein [Carideicomes alvinocaridis]